ncbi:lysophospholipid acyltransferase family protein [Ornithinibacillus halophilus]|uniref:1-acyl-sn-glycerol-3-phosphate acyltransferase n=1 Tax=Ornithinibacillus halophilus TaxID=930117 RepID=A0A1M5EXQ9_9BACI|nr:lysophospholipid acyltransferase family protein [Ornithinibacillus halophilus]SHF83927.1 1-acyl-sn-glycerol-3-phosphate acyltransferase [Ornithinibacillus halophilus]
MIFTLWIYLYAGLLVIGSWFSLQRAKKLSNQPMTADIKEQIFNTPKRVSQKVIERTGTKVEVTGQEKVPDGAVLYVANHQGLFDILAFLGYLGRPVGFIAKKEINKLPIIRTWMGIIYCVFIDRADRRQSMKAINQGIENLKNGHSMVIFPEGTRSRGRTLNEFKPGSLRLATKAGVSIVPVAIDGTYQMLEEGGGRVKGSTINITIHNPIRPEEYKELKSAELAERIQSVIQQSLDGENAQKEQQEEVFIGSH